MSSLGDARGAGGAQSALRFYPVVSAGHLSAGHTSRADAEDRQPRFASEPEEQLVHEAHAYDRNGYEPNDCEPSVREQTTRAARAHDQGSHAWSPQAWRQASSDGEQRSGSEQRLDAEQRPKAEQSVAELIDAELLEELESQHVANFGAPRSDNPLGQLPMASLEGPSLARLDLTPSPVPRVSLVPATGSLDISLVPGPHSIGSRNLPTLAARHAVGRAKPKRRAPAVTLPPPGASAHDVSGSGQVAKGVPSSKREIVLGLSIGIGLSVLLAVLGQAYLGEERPVAAPPGLDIQTLALAAPPKDSPAPAAELSMPVPSSAVSSPGVSSPAAAPVSEARPLPPANEHSAVSSDEVRKGVGKVAAPRRAGSARKERAQHMNRASAAPPSFFQSEVGKSLDGLSPEKTPLSPSESAGLGLDLPL